MNNQHLYQTLKQHLRGLLHNRSRFLIANCIVACSLLAVLIGGCNISRAASSQDTPHTSSVASSQHTVHMSSSVAPDQNTTAGDSISQSFAVSGTPTLVIDNDAGGIYISSGASGTVAVTATKYSSDGNTSDMTVTLSQSGNTIYMTGRLPQQQTNGVDKHIDFTITTPATSNIQVTTKAGLVSIQGISGQISVNAETAEIDMQQVALQGQSTFQTTANAIKFQGSLDPSGSYSFDSTTGLIDLTLPASASFELHITTFIGTVDNQFGSDTAGSPPYAQVAIKTTVGQITIQKGA